MQCFTIRPPWCNIIQLLHHTNVSQSITSLIITCSNYNIYCLKLHAIFLNNQTNYSSTIHRVPCAASLVPCPLSVSALAWPFVVINRKLCGDVLKWRLVSFCIASLVSVCACLAICCDKQETVWRRAEMAFGLVLYRVSCQCLRLLGHLLW